MSLKEACQRGGKRMLTQSEREWLYNRDNYAEHFCRWCDVWEDCLGELDAIFCPSWPKKVQLREAAEFEGRVVEKLAKFFKSYVKSSVCADLESSTLCPGWPVCTDDVSKPHPPCDFSILKGVRLEVEEEIDADGK